MIRPLTSKTLLQIGCAIVAVPIFVLFPTGPLASVEPERPQAPVPHPSEISLLDELSAWGEPATSEPSFERGMLTGSSAISSRSQVESLPYGAEIWRAAKRYQVDGMLLASIVETESSFDPEAVSPVGAMGLMQIMPASAAPYGLDNLVDPVDNLEAGTRYISEMLELFEGDLILALAAYNAGPANVRRYGGVPPFPETQRYIDRVLKRYLDHVRKAWIDEGLVLPDTQKRRREVAVLVEGPSKDEHSLR